MARVAVALAGLTCGLTLAGCGSSFHAPSLPCNPKPQGALCLKVFHDSGKVSDVIAYLSASASPLAGKTWRLALTWGRSGIAPTQAFHGNPPVEVLCKASQRRTVTTGAGCDNTLGEAVASHGDFRDFRVPVVSLPVPLCVKEQVRENGKWVAGPAKPACAPS